MASPEFDVIHVFGVGDRGTFVMARQVGVEPFTLGRGAALGEVAIEASIERPRKLLPDGTPDLSVFVFKLKDAGAAESLMTGQRVVLNGANPVGSGHCETARTKRWGWIFCVPPLIVFLASLWSVVALGRWQARTHEQSYALFAHTDSTGDGKIYWKLGGEREAFDRLQLPFYSCVLVLVAFVASTSTYLYRAVGVSVLLSYWLLCLICGAVALSLFAWLWVNVVGAFI